MERLMLLAWARASLIVVLFASGGCASAASSPAVAPPAVETAVSRGASASPTSAPLRPLKMAYAFATAETVPMWVAEEQGLYRKHGLEVETILMQSSAQVAPAMVAGEIDVALTAGAGVVDIDLAGGDQLIVASQTSNLMRFYLNARPEIRRVEDLRDKRIAITRLGSGVHLATQIVLEKAGLEAGRDAQLIQAGAADSQLSALVSGAADAATFALPTNLIAERQGYPQLADLKNYRVPYMQGALAVTRPTLQARYDVVRDFVAAQIEAMGMAKRDKALAVRLLGKYTQTDDQELLDQSYRLWIEDMAESPRPSLEGVQSVLDQRAPEIAAARTADPRDFVDDRIVRELEASGFVSSALARTGQ
jgi:NitT/TauT family transport system substrate-binding protein